ncbi:MAG: Fic family protein [Endomicrobium sp.]|jgi:Fic family protein|nr:Fic family protein [Endomicrobium sp.]
MHAQFELLHPFIDGNGRVGRLLIPLFLYEKRVISKPVFYISSYFERNRQEYYSNLNIISKDSNWLKWIEFFLK